MKGLLGTFEHQLDEKNRIRIPAKLLEVFKNEYANEALYFVMYNRNRVAMMSESVLHSKLAILGEVLPNDEEGSDAISRLYGSIEDVNKDGQGRAIIPKLHRREASIEKEVVTVGMGNYIEIWAKEVRAAQIDSMTLSEANKKAYARLQTQKGV